MSIKAHTFGSRRSPNSHVCIDSRILWRYTESFQAGASDPGQRMFLGKQPEICKFFVTAQVGRRRSNSCAPLDWRCCCHQFSVCGIHLSPTQFVIRYLSWLRFNLFWKQQIELRVSWHYNWHQDQLHTELKIGRIYYAENALKCATSENRTPDVPPFRDEIKRGNPQPIDGKKLLNIPSQHLTRCAIYYGRLGTANELALWEKYLKLYNLAWNVTNAFVRLEPYTIPLRCIQKCLPTNSLVKDKGYSITLHTVYGADLGLKYYRTSRYRMRYVIIVLVERKCTGCTYKRSSLSETTYINKDFNECYMCSFWVRIKLCGARVELRMCWWYEYKTMNATLQNAIVKSERVPEYNKFQGRLSN